MNSVSGFDNDLFLSYAHLDNEPLVEGQRGWVSSFRRTLEVRLAQILGVKPKVWWDRSGLRGNDAFADVIGVELGKVALFIPVLTPAFLESDWCAKELAQFLAACETADRARTGGVSRIFKVLKTPVPREQHPAELQGRLGYEFFRYDSETGKLREMRQESSPEDYMKKLDDLALDICMELRRMLGEPTPAPDPSKQETLYLAESTFDVRDERDLLLRSLRQREEITVLPEGPLPTHGPDLRQRVGEDIARCRLSIHVLGANYGTIPEAEDLSVGEIQNEIAAQRSAADAEFERLIWMPPGSEPAGGFERMKQR